MPNYFDQFDSPQTPGPQSIPPIIQIPPAPQTGAAPDGVSAPIALPGGKYGSFQGGHVVDESGAPVSGGNFFDQFDGPSASGSNQPSISSLVGNTGAGINERIARYGGAPVDLVTWLMNQGIRGANSVAGTNIPQIDRPFLGSENIKLLLGTIGANPDQVQPTNEAERAARAAGGAIGDALAMTTGARYLAPLIPESMPVTRGVTEALGNAPLPTTAISAGTGAAAGQVAQEAVPDEYAQWRPLANFGANLGTAGLTALGLQGAKRLAGSAYDAVERLLSPLTQSGRQGLAGEQLASAATDVGEVRSKLSDLENGGQLVEGSQPTTFQATGDAGLGRLERAQATKNSDIFNERRASNNAARVGELNDLAPEGAQSGAVGGHLSQQLADADANTQAIYDDALQRAQSRALALGGNLTDEQYGSIMRGELAGAKAAAKADESAKWAAIDPRNNLNIDVTPTKDAAQSILDAIPEDARQPAGAEADVFNKITSWPDVRGFRNFAAVRGDLLAAIREERMNGETPALRRMQQLRSAMDNTIAGAGTAAEAAEPSAVEAGQAAAPATPVNAPGVGGTIYTPSGRNVGARYEVVEGNSLVPSHTQDLEQNPNFPAELQPRERGRIASETQIANMAAKLQPERLGASTSPTEGAPIVGPDNVVESGNARTLAVLRAYQQGGAKAQAYRDYLNQQGYNTEGLENPILIRRRTTDLSPTERVRFAQEANTSPALAMSATERAAVDAQRLSPSVLEQYKGGDINSVENRPFVRAFAKSVVDPTETGSFATAEGGLSVDGARRVENALLARAYGNSDVVSALAENGDPNLKAFGGTLKAVAGDIARLHDRVAAGEVPEQFDISKPLAEAAALVQRARASKEPLSDILAQRDAFNQVSPMAERIARAAFGPDLRQRLNANKLADILSRYTQEAAKQSTAPRLLADEVAPEEILAAAGARYGRAFEPIETAAAPAAVSPGRFGGAGPSNGVGGEEARRSGIGTGGPGAGAGERPQEGLLGGPPLEPNFGADAAQRYREAANATRERAQTFGTGPVGRALQRGQGGLPYNLSDAQVAARFFNSGPRSFDDATAYLRAAGDRPAAVEALRDYAASDLRGYAGRPDGTLDPAKVGKWLDNHPAMRLFPELADTFENAASADRAVNLAAESRRALLDTYQKGVASQFLNGTDPSRAFETALRGGAPAMRQLSDMVAANPDAQAGLQKAAVELMQRRFLSNDLAGDTGTTFIKPAMFQNFVRENRPALSEIFSPAQLDSMDAIAADLQRSNLSISGSKLPGGSNTAQDLLASGHGSDKSMFGKIVVAEVLGNLGEAATGHSTGIAGHALAALYFVGSHIRDAGLRKVDDLVTQAMLDPELARTLLLKVSDEQVPAVAQVLANQLRPLSVLAAAGSRPREPEESSSRGPSLLIGDSPQVAPSYPLAPQQARPNLLATPPASSTMTTR